MYRPKPLALVVLCGTLLSGTCFAWKNSINWNNTPMKQPISLVGYYVNPSGAPPGFSETIQAAARSWSGISGTNIGFAFLGASTQTDQHDRRNVIYWNSAGAGLSSETLAVTTTWTLSDGQITEFDMEFNGTKRFATDGNRNSFDLQSVAVHEAGHAIGFGHEDVLTSVMKSTIAQGSMKRVLFDTDIEGARALYPGPLCIGTIRGDANQDMQFNVTDAVAILRTVVNLSPAPTGCLLQAQDVNCDGAVQVEDAVTILKNVTQGIPFPTCQ
ncbi:MAG: matrixin family metalloprotease [Armatimonadetes bacterium]|nr:matrixin family metalloprotease [Armatimonadota bacterium]